MELFNSYQFIAGISIVVIVSYFFNIVSKKTNIPSVLLLIVLGILIKLGFDQLGANLESDQLLTPLEILGTIGLIMIVLEAALDLDIEKEKLPAIGKAFLVGLLGLIAGSFACAGILVGILEMEFITALLYAIPLAILSSAIIIPSVEGLLQHKREFMVYESAFSDILGIMFFYYVKDIVKLHSVTEATWQFGKGFVIISLISIIASYLLVVIFQNIRSHVKLFLLISILLLLYAVGKMLHLSPLLLILVFGLVLTNYELFFRGPLKKYANPERIESIEKDFHIITIETAFLVRTFFFVVFGMSIVLSSLLSWDVFLISMLIILALYAVRFIFLKLVVQKDIVPELWIAPRGLITVLLFYQLDNNEKYRDESFDPGILLFVIFVTSLVMTFGLIANARKRAALEAAEGTLAAPATIEPDLEADIAEPSIESDPMDLLPDNDVSLEDGDIDEH